jgi:hypothetical protein
MRVVTNKKLARRNKTITNYLFFGTFGTLILGFFFINSSLFTGETPDNLTIILQASILPVAFVLTIVSVRMTNLWARMPRPENAIEDGLKGLSNKSVLYNYYHFPARHVLICPQGVFAIITRWHDQEYTVKDGKFKSHKNIISRFFSGLRFDGIGKPFAEAEYAKDQVQKSLKTIAPDVEVKPLIVFVDPSATLNVEDKSNDIPLVFSDTKTKPNLKDYMRDVKRQLAESNGNSKNTSTMPLTEEQIEAFEQATIKK